MPAPGSPGSPLPWAWGVPEAASQQSLLRGMEEASRGDLTAEHRLQAASPRLEAGAGLVQSSQRALDLACCLQGCPLLWHCTPLCCPRFGRDLWPRRHSRYPKRFQMHLAREAQPAAFLCRAAALSSAWLNHGGVYSHRLNLPDSARTGSWQFLSRVITAAP